MLCLTSLALLWFIGSSAASGRLSATAAPPAIEWNKNLFYEVPNETYWRAHDILYNWETESEAPATSNNSIVYISMGTLGGLLLFIIVLDLTNMARYIRVIKQNISSFRKREISKDVEAEKENRIETTSSKPTAFVLTVVKAKLNRTQLNTSAPEEPEQSHAVVEANAGSSII